MERCDPITIEILTDAIKTADDVKILKFADEWVDFEDIYCGIDYQKQRPTLRYHIRKLVAAGLLSQRRVRRHNQYKREHDTITFNFKKDRRETI